MLAAGSSEDGSAGIASVLIDSPELGAGAWTGSAETGPVFCADSLAEGESEVGSVLTTGSMVVC